MSIRTIIRSMLDDAGSKGVSIDDLVMEIYDDQEAEAAEHTVRSKIVLLNKSFREEGAGFKITKCSDGQYRYVGDGAPKFTPVAPKNGLWRSRFHEGSSPRAGR